MCWLFGSRLWKKILEVELWLSDLQVTGSCHTIERLVVQDRLLELSARCLHHRVPYEWFPRFCFLCLLGGRWVGNFGVAFRFHNRIKLERIERDGLHTAHLEITVDVTVFSNYSSNCKSREIVAF